MAEHKTFLNVDDVCNALECSKSKAYGIMRELNAEMKQSGYITMAGRINAKYFYERIYNGKAVEH